MCSITELENASGNCGPRTELGRVRHLHRDVPLVEPLALERLRSTATISFVLLKRSSAALGPGAHVEDALTRLMCALEELARRFSRHRRTRSSSLPTCGCGRR